jgi:putative PIN family toxin of toxin-antitoxin system
VVFDTNVLISALLWPGSVPAQVVALARQGRVLAVISPALLEELRRVLRKKLGFEEEAAEAVLEAVAEHSELVNPKQTLHVIREDPEDDRVLECAVEGRADAIVTGERHLLQLKEYRGVAILKPREFLDLEK